uniref:LSM1 homolog, mRNA degradation associated n=1 Tax=Ovis aries TaxID=9940 RepID=A0AC11EFN7_SHEEP
MNYMPGTASLIEDIDKKHLVLLRDGRTLIGFLRSIDQFGKRKTRSHLHSVDAQLFVKSLASTSRIMRYGALSNKLIVGKQHCHNHTNSSAHNIGKSRR